MKPNTQTSILLCTMGLLLGIYTLQAQSLPKEDSLQFNQNLPIDTLQELPDSPVNLEAKPLASEALSNLKGDTGNRSDRNAFWGAALGAFISAIVSIGIFWTTNRKQEKKQDKVMKLSLNVIYELFEQSISYLERFITEIKKIENQYEALKNTDIITQALPYKVPYALLRLKYYDIHLFSEVMAEFNVDGYPEMVTNIDFLCHYLEDINDYFHDKDIELRSIKEKEKLIELYSEIIKYTKGSDEDSGPLNTLTKHKQKFELFLAKIKKQ